MLTLELRQASRDLLPESKSSAEIYSVIILDNNINTYEQVIAICMQALGISYLDAYDIALAVDHNGRAEVFQGVQGEAEAVANIIRTIGISVLVLPRSDAANSHGP
ncbi:MAG: ATP-dependent Clp protease adaptor ClpS [Spirochaetia bacterium]|nr:ATP-dependent Clp protease adaptor ClpS [Spirochaetia bacterium]